MKAKSDFNNYWVGMVKNEQGLEDHGILKPGISHKWFAELSGFIEWFLHVDIDGIIFCSTLYLWHLNAGGPAVVFSQSFLEKFPFC